MRQAEFSFDNTSSSLRERMIRENPGKSERHLAWIAVQPDGLFYQYVGWINRGLAAFKAELGIGSDQDFTWKQGDEFTAWLWEHGAKYVVEES